MENHAILVKDYVPRSFGKEYWNVKGPPQYPMFAAVALGLKPVMDDWVDVHDYERLADACAAYGLVMAPDIVFAPAEGSKEGIIGGRNITTTYFRGEKFTGQNTEGQVHILIARDKQAASDARKWAWYSLVINGRSTNKPFVDHLRYGKCLGYPPCCVNFFRTYNNWHLFSNPFETLKNTAFENGNAIGSHYCNNFLMDKGYSYIHHLPCSYRCKASTALAQELEKKLDTLEPAFIQTANRLLRKPLLVFGEQHFAIFDGELQKTAGGASISYRACQYFRNPSRPEEDIAFFDEIQAGDALVMNDSHILIKDGTTTIRKAERKKEWFLIDFD